MTAVKLVLLVVAIHLVIFAMFKDTSIAQLPEQGTLQKAVLAAG